MPRTDHAAMWLVVAACGTACGTMTAPPANIAPDDARTSPDAPEDAAAAPDAPGDAGRPDPGPDGGVGSTDLAVICGRVPETPDQWEDCFARRKCEWQVGCQFYNAFLDVDQCLRLGDDFSGGRLGEERLERARSIAQLRAQVNVPAFTQCLIDTSATRCNTALYDPSCLTRYTGTIADGGTCYTDIDCESPDALCSTACSDNACCEGRCAPKRKEGQSCTTFRSCEPGLNCNGTCIAGDADTSCSDSGDCDPGTWCDLAARRCTPTLPVGAACTSLLQCGGDTACIGMSIISAEPGHCLRNSQPGDPCDGVLPCHGNLYCGSSSQPGLGQCHELPRPGDACSALVPCAGVDTFCDSGVCKARSNAGDGCTSQTCMPGLFCTAALGEQSAACVERRAPGLACNDPSQCESSLCSGKPGVCLAWRETCPY